MACETLPAIDVWPSLRSAPWNGTRCIADAVVETHDRIVGKTWQDAKKLCDDTDR